MNNWDPSTLQQMLGLIAFVLVVVIIFSWSTALLVYTGIQKFNRKSSPQLNKRDLTVLTLGGLGVLCVLYGLLVEPYWLSIEHISLISHKLKTGQAIRVVQISDLHCDSKIRLEDKLPEVISQQKPDIIVFTGDAINMPDGLPIFRRCLERLAKIAPTFVVKGNWDAWYFKNLDRFNGTGASELIDKAVEIHLTAINVLVAGLPVGTNKSVSDVLKNTPENDYRIFLFHYPDFIEEMEKNKVDLYLAGHTHGGQVALPLYGALVTLSSRGKQFESGLHHLGDTYEYTNRGIGMEGGKAPRVRFCARPEVTVFDITGDR